MKVRRFWKGIAFVVFAAAALGVAGLVVMSLWNWLVPVLFHGPELHFWQALGLLALTRVLFGRFGRGRGHRGWRGRMRHDWEQMSPEEREKLRQTFYGRCGSRGMPHEQPKT